jgi:hypothetical protein
VATTHWLPLGQLIAEVVARDIRSVAIIGEHTSKREIGREPLTSLDFNEVKRCPFDLHQWIDRSILSQQPEPERNLRRM